MSEFLALRVKQRPRPVGLALGRFHDECVRVQALSGACIHSDDFLAHIHSLYIKCYFNSLSIFSANGTYHVRTSSAVGV